MTPLDTPPDRAISDSEVSKALDAAVRTRVLRFLPVVAFLYLLRSAVSTTPLLPALATAVCCSAVWLIHRQNTLSDRRVQPLVFTTLTLMLSATLIQQNISAGVSQLPLLLLLMLAAAGTLLSWRWFGAFTSLALLGWAFGGLQTLPSKSWTVSGVEVLLTGAFSCLAFRARLRSQQEIQKLRLWTEK